MKKKFGLMKYPGVPTYNVGDYVQSLAAKQFLPQVDQIISREELNSYSGEQVSMIMNGWYMHNPNNFKPSSNINPLYISFHLNSRVKDIILNNEENVKYLKSKAPIGCRDNFTLEALQSKGIDSYYSSCLTTTLGLKYKKEETNDEIYFADPLWILPNKKKMFYGLNYFVRSFTKGEVFNLGKQKKTLAKIFNSDIMNQQKSLVHILPKKHSEDKRFEEAEIFLEKLAKAKLVVTSRIHAALPCLALGTKVIFVNYGFTLASDQSRFKGIVELFNTINIDPNGKISSNFFWDGKSKFSLEDIEKLENPTKHIKYAEKLAKTCEDFIVK